MKNKVTIFSESKSCWIHESTDDRTQIFDYMVDGCVVGRVSLNLRNNGMIYIHKHGKVRVEKLHIDD